MIPVNAKQQNTSDWPNQLIYHSRGQYFHQNHKHDIIIIEILDLSMIISPIWHMAEYDALFVFVLFRGI